MEIRKGRALALVAMLSLAVAGSATRADAGATWACNDASAFHPLSTINGPGQYIDDPNTAMSFRFVSQGQGTFSASSRTLTPDGYVCEIHCLFSGMQSGRVETCSLAAYSNIVVTVTNGQAVALAQDPNRQPGIALPGTGPVGDGLFAENPCPDCVTREVRVGRFVPTELKNQVVVRGRMADGRYTVTIEAAGEPVVPPISVEEVAPLPPFEVALLPDDLPVDVNVLARYHPGARRCLVAVGDPEVCGPLGPLRTPREDARWREAGLIIEAGQQRLFVPYLGQLCAGHQTPGGDDMTFC